MAAEKSPAFQFYPKDFLTDSHVVAMTLPERGAYITLLCLCWMDHSIPSDHAALARLCGTTNSSFAKIWPSLLPCFTKKDGRLIQPRIERERQKQTTYRNMKAEAGRLGGKAKAEAYQTASSGLVDAIAESSPPSSSSSPSPSPSPSASPIPVTNNNLVTTAVVVTKGNGNGNGHNARSKHPIFSGQRFVVFDWMLEDIGRTLGNHLDAFDVHEWFFSLDARAVKDSIVKPKNDWWPWIQAELLAEAEKRGLPTAEPKKFGVTTKTAGNAAALKRFAERKSS